MCPKGDDPFTPFTDYPTIYIKVDQFLTASGSYRFRFDGQSIALPTSQIADQDCETLFLQLPNLADVECSVAKNGRYGGYIISLQIIAFPTLPYQNNIYNHEGNISPSSFSCDNSGVSTSGTASCTISTVAIDLLPG